MCHAAQKASTTYYRFITADITHLEQIIDAAMSLLKEAGDGGWGGGGRVGVGTVVKKTGAS